MAMCQYGRAADRGPSLGFVSGGSAPGPNPLQTPLNNNNNNKDTKPLRHAKPTLHVSGCGTRLSHPGKSSLPIPTTQDPPQQSSKKRVCHAIATLVCHVSVPYLQRPAFAKCPSRVRNVFATRRQRVCHELRNGNAFVTCLAVCVHADKHTQTTRASKPRRDNRSLVLLHHHHHRTPTRPAYAGKGVAFLGIPGRLGGGGSVAIRGNCRHFPTQPAYAGSVQPPWEFQEGRGAVGPLVFVVTPPPLHQPDLLTFEGCGLSGNPRKADAWWAVAVCTTGSNAAVQLP